MDITGTNSLWKDYDVTTLPINETELSEKTENGITVHDYYFDGYTTVDGKARAYLKVYEHAKAKGVVLFMPEIDGNTDIAKSIYDKGYSVAILDYIGKRENAARYTIYPRSLGECNCYTQKSFEAPKEAISSTWFIWTCIARRAVLLLKKLYKDKKLYATGVGLGGSTIYKLTAFNDGLTAVATLNNIIPEVTGSGNNMIVYRASLDNAAYAPSTQIPLLMAIASNDEDGSLDEMSELADETESLKVLRIVERSFKKGVKSVIPQIDRFFDANANGPANIPEIKVKATNSENNLYINITTNNSNDERKFKEVGLYVAFCTEDPRFRNWMNIPAIRLAGDEYMARVDVLQDTKPVYVFANLSDDDGNVLSSALASIIPKTLGIPAIPAVKHRLIYDGSMGKDVWTSPDGSDVKLTKGPLDIECVSGSESGIVTFKPGDPLYTANSDSLLQIIVCGRSQTINIEATDGKETFKSTISLPNTTDWHKFTLSQSDFKGTGGLLNWTKIIEIKLYAEQEFMISSMLWV